MQHTHLTTIAVPTHKKSHFTIQRVNYVTFPFSTGRVFAKQLFLPHEIRMRSHTVAMFLFSLCLFLSFYNIFFFLQGLWTGKGGGGSEVENGHKSTCSPVWVCWGNATLTLSLHILFDRPDQTNGLRIVRHKWSPRACWLPPLMNNHICRIQVTRSAAFSSSPFLSVCLGKEPRCLQIVSFAFRTHSTWI